MGIQDMTDDDLSQIGITKMGHRRKMLKYLKISAYDDVHSVRSLDELDGINGLDLSTGDIVDEVVNEDRRRQAVSKYWENSEKVESPDSERQLKIQRILSFGPNNSIFGAT